MTDIDGLGFLAAGLVLATFCMKRLVPLRALAITSNLTFILYGYCAAIEPVLVLHLVLLPLNVFRLLQALPVRAPEAGHSRQPWSDKVTGRGRQMLAALLGVIAATAEIASDHSAHPQAGKGSGREPAFGVLAHELWHILDRVRRS